MRSIMQKWGLRLLAGALAALLLPKVAGAQDGKPPWTRVVSGGLEGAHQGSEPRLAPTRDVYALPSPDEVAVDLAGIEDPSAAVVPSSVYEGCAPSSLSSRFIERLGGLVEHKRVLFFGESHWDVEINRLFGDMLGSRPTVSSPKRHACGRSCATRRQKPRHMHG